MITQRRRPLTAYEIRNLRLRTIGLRKGYDPGAVHELLQRLAQETASRDATITDLANRLHRAEIEAYARRHGALPASPTANLDDLVSDIDLRMKAQQYADELVALAQHAGAQIVEQSRHQAARIIAAAHADGEEVTHAYRTQAALDQRPDRAELARLLGLVQWAQAQLAALHQQVRSTDLAVGQELRSIAERLRPALGPAVADVDQVESAASSDQDRQHGVARPVTGV
jgi:DivIVA domain-containing protein